MTDDAPVLAEQVAYYRARAPKYAGGALDLPGVDELEAAVDAFAARGDVLELACGPGTWTPRLLDRAATVTAVDAAPEMLALARDHVRDPRVRFVRADLFSWRPDRRYDAVFFGFWLSHVPAPRFRPFWDTVRDCLVPGGRVLFVDDAHRTPDELVHGPESSTIRRRCDDGRAYQVVKVPYEPADLEARLRGLGWDVAVHPTAGPFYWGAGTPVGDSLGG